MSRGKGVRQEMKTTCPHCGKTFTLNGMGRKKKDIAGNIVYATLLASYSTTAAAKKLKVSRGWVNNWIRQEMVRKLLTRAEFLAKYMPEGNNK